ncbi:MAG: hypothetical protein WBB55_01830 [Anaerolineales bacterium]
MSVQNKYSNLIRCLIVLGMLVAALGLFGFSAPNVDRTDLYPKGFQPITRSLLPDTDFSRVDALTLTASEYDLLSAVIDPAGGYAYFGTGTSPGVVVKVRLSDFTRVGALTLNSGENDLYSAVIDPVGGYAYFGTYTSPGVVVKVRLSDFTRVGALTLNPGENGLYSAVIDPAGGYAYFGTYTSPGIVVKIDLGLRLLYLPVVFR